MFSPATGYAAIALGYLAESESRSETVDDIARAVDIPAAYLGKIMHTLARRGLVQTRRGVGGGVVLNCDTKQITLLDLCKVLDDPVIEQRCMLGVTECSDERACPAHEFWTRHRQKLLHFAGRTSIQAIGEFERKRRLKAGQAPEAKQGSRSSSASRASLRKARGK